MTWDVEIIEGYASDLVKALERLRAQGALIRFVLPNGVNRWTVIVERPAP